MNHTIEIPAQGAQHWEDVEIETSIDGSGHRWKVIPGPFVDLSLYPTQDDAISAAEKHLGGVHAHDCICR